MNESTITAEDQAKISKLLDTMVLPSGLGDERSACSIAAINLALSGRLTDDIPGCMSRVIGYWIIRTQDAMPAEMRNSACWKQLLPLAAGTGRDPSKEGLRRKLILKWLFGSCLVQLQPIADKRGFGVPWAKMLTEKSVDACLSARAAVVGRGFLFWADAAARAAAAADAAARAAAADAAADAAAAAAARAAAAAARAAARAAADADADAAARAEYWRKADPCELLKKLIEV